MHLTSRIRRRIIVAAAAGSAAILVPAVALAAAAAPRPAPAVVRACHAASIEAWLGLGEGGATAGTTFYPLEFSNISKHTCTLFGFPGVSAINSSGHRVGPPARSSGPRRKVTLRPGGTVHALLGIVQSGFIAGCHQVTGRGLAVFPPNQVVRQEIGSFSFPACTNKVFMSVSSVQAGVGIP
jgi:hypothetical protein